MSLDIEKYEKILRRLPKPILRWVEKRLKKIPKFRAMIEAEDEKLRETLDHSLKPYREVFSRNFEIPKEGISKDQILSDMKKMNELETPRWQQGYVSGGIYHGDPSHIDFLNEVYTLHSQSNPLHSDLFPSATKFEAEIVSMVAGILGKGQALDTDKVCGTVTSGGTESILLAMKTYRDHARMKRGITRPEIIAATTAHVAFDKAADFFGLKLVKIPLGADYKMNVAIAKKAVNRNTIAIVASAPAFPHGVIDPIESLSAIALEKGIGLHVDCCLGGFVLPFAEKLGAPVPPFDFRLKGVTSISIDTHKYGYAAKGTSVCLYRNEELRHHQFFTATDWPGGLYFSPTLAGSRPGALSAACWASLMATGEKGYLEATQAILNTAEKIKSGIRSIPELKILGEPLWIIAFASDTLNIYEVLDQMTKRQWNLNGLHHPESVHIALTLRHTQPGIAEKFLADLKESIEAVKANPGLTNGMAPVYGMASSLPFRGLVSDLLKKTLDAIYRV